MTDKDMIDDSGVADAAGAQLGIIAEHLDRKSVV